MNLVSGDNDIKFSALAEIIGLDLGIAWEE